MLISRFHQVDDYLMEPPLFSVQNYFGVEIERRAAR